MAAEQGGAGIAATDAFRLHGESHREASSGASNGAGSVFDFFTGKGEMRLTEPFVRIASNMIQAMGYFESSLGLQTALGHQSFSPPPLIGGKVPSSLFSSRGK